MKERANDRDELKKTSTDEVVVSYDKRRDGGNCRDFVLEIDRFGSTERSSEWRVCDFRLYVGQDSRVYGLKLPRELVPHPVLQCCTVIAQYKGRRSAFTLSVSSQGSFRTQHPLCYTAIT